MTERVILAQGNGGRLMRELIDEIFLPAFGANAPDASTDAAVLPRPEARPVVTTDSFTVQPLEFPGGTLGSLAVHGTVNDLAVSGAEPRYLTLGAILEEGLEIAVLRRLVADLAAAATAAGVRVVAGDTKVVPRGSGGGAYFAVAGIGEERRADLSLAGIRDGDALVVSGPVGDHGVAVMLARAEFDLEGEVRSDSAPVLDLCRAAWAFDGLRFLRDPTRGGLATVAHEIAAATGLGVRLCETAIPVRAEAHAVCDILGYDPYFLACEGRAVAVVAADQAAALCAAWQALPEGRDAAVIGRIDTGTGVVLDTAIGGERYLPELEDDPLPRIC